MKTWILFWWDQLRETLWFLPSLMAVGAAASATLLLWVDRGLSVELHSSLAWLSTTHSSAQVVLGSLISALVTVLGLTFSLTMLAVSQTASQFGPRLVRSIFDRNVAQSVLGLYLGTVIYCMFVIRSLRDVEKDGSDFIPNLSLFIAELLGAACLFALLYFANHVTSCMRPEMLLQRIFRDAMTSIKNLAPEQKEGAGGTEVTAAALKWPERSKPTRLRSRSNGYLQAIELETLINIAATRKHKVRVSVRPGDFVYESSELAEVLDDQGESVDEDDLCEYAEAFLIGLTRTPRQDLESTFWELTEAGVRALSPGINDPVTAMNVVDYLAAALRALAQRQISSGMLEDEEGTTRIEMRTFTFDSALSTAYDNLRQHAASNVAVICRLLEGLCAVSEVTEDSTVRESIAQQANMIYEHAQRNIEDEKDLRDIKERVDAIDS